MRLERNKFNFNIFLFSILSIAILLLVFILSNSFEEPKMPFVLTGQEIRVGDYKYSNTEGIFVNSLSEINCRWKNPKMMMGIKFVKLFFEIEDLRPSKSIIKDPLIYLDFEKQSSVQNIEVFYSTDSFELSNFQEIPKIVENSPKEGSFITGEVISSGEEKEFLGAKRTLLKEEAVIEEVEYDSEKVSKNVFSNFFYVEEGKITLKEVEEEERKENMKKTISGNVVSVFDAESFDTSKPFAVLVKFEVPKYEENSFNFEIIEEGFNAKLDPEVGGCGVLGTPNSIYLLNQSVGASRTCFEIYANNITLDCQGNTISFGETLNQSYGVHTNASDTTIKNCVFSNSDQGTTQGMGVYFDSARNGVVQDSSFNLKGYLSYGILVKNGADNFVSKDNVFGLEGSSSFGIKVENSDDFSLEGNEISSLSSASTKAFSFIDSSYGEVFDNVINIGGEGSNALYMDYGTGYNIYENLFYTENDAGDTIALRDSYSNNIFSNYIDVGGLYSAGYHSFGGSQRNDFYENEVRSFDIDRYGIFLEGDFGTEIYDSVISTDGDFGYGLLIYGSDENNFENLTISTTGNDACGIFLDSPSTGNSFSSVFVNTQGMRASSLYVWYEDNNFSFYDSVFDSEYPNQEEVYFDSYVEGNPGNYDFINTSFDSDYWAPTCDGNLDVFWYLDSEVHFFNGTGVEGAVVKGYDENWNLLFEESTDSDYFIPTKTLKSYSKVGPSSLSYESVYYLNTSFNETTNFSEEINLTSNFLVSFTYPSEPLRIYVEDDSPSSSGGRSCDPLWVCSTWSECIDGEKTRECTNENPDCDVDEPNMVEECDAKKTKKEKKTLFDVNAKLLRQRITPPSNLSAKITLLNVGDPGKVLANLTYSIIDSQGTLLYFEEDQITVDTQIEFMKTFRTDTYFEGRYDLFIDLDYEGQTEPATARERFYVGSGFYFTWINTVLIFFILVVSSLIIYSMIKKKLHEENQDSY